MDRLIFGAQITDVVLADGGYNYYLYVRADGFFAITRENVAGTEYRYFIGKEDYSTKWSGRAGLDYIYPDKLNMDLFKNMLQEFRGGANI